MAVFEVFEERRIMTCDHHFNKPKDDSYATYSHLKFLDDDHSKFEELSHKFIYHGEQTIKYITFYYDLYNAVDDCVGTVSEKQTGPFLPNKQYSRCRPLKPLYIKDYYVSFQLSQIAVTFMDGSKKIFSGDDISFDEKPRNFRGGCYVATCVYGSYDCPEVWTLRRYRDNNLAETWYGRLFIRTYYAISPTIVKWFGKTKWFQRFWRGRLDKMVKKLQNEGVESTPYQDKDW